ncbi:MAG: hypothetical protein HN522_06155 [Flavobacteriales bacterium]|jgi:hypothetical protein|nr:hypothetical protein [Flavobacteriales bacterium]MBT5090141.1 hypothetical protein [Flavobacteriales bacterium]MBT5750115.1 hypothetical protein [Flavobacteriales bacterium]
MTRFLFFSLFLFSSCTWNELPKIICVPDEQVYFELIQPIIENNCISCHSTAANMPAVLVSYDGIVEALRNYSLKEEVINRTMPPPLSPPLSESEINIIQKWADCE